MLTQFLQYIQTQDLFDTQHKILLAISGGIDSRVMFDLFLKAQKYSFAIAHCNFGLRNQASDEDELFVKDLGKQHQIPVYTKLFDTEMYAQKHKISIQMAARDLRYAWFEEIMKTENYNFLATAHQKNDIVETVLLNLTRGTGIAGLHGILPKNKNIVRPLLFAQKEDIEEYAQKYHLNWREDASNAEDKYDRNLVRLQVIPLLKKLNPSLENTFALNVEKFAQTEAVFLEKIKAVSKIACTKVGQTHFINLPILAELENSLIILSQILQDFGFSYLQSQEIWKKRQKHSGKVFESQNYSLVKDRKQLVITPNISLKNITHLIFKNQAFLANPLLKLSLETIEVNPQFKIEATSHIAYLDLAKLKFPLELRIWQEGEKFFPLGMKSQKKISDFLINSKVPLNLKNKVFVLVSDKQVVWLVGHRIDERFKIRAESKQVLKIMVEHKL